MKLSSSPFFVIALAATLAASGPLAASEKGEIKDKKADLKEVQSRIRDLQKEISRTEESRAEASDDLEETEASISETSRRLHELGSERGGLERELARLTAKNTALEKRIQTQQIQLEQMLGRYYLSGQARGLRHLLSGSDPNQLARDLHYLKLLTQAESDLIGQLTRDLAEQKKLAEEIAAKRDALGKVERSRKQELDQLASERKKHQTLVAKLGDRIREQRREVANLKRDEQRLSKLIDGLAKLAMQRRLPPPPKKDSKAPAQNVTAGPIARIEDTPEAGSGGGEFTQLRGRLKLPVKGELMNRFGSPRAEGTSWRGLFIRANAGAEVKAVAAGRVVFADWLRGFGNLIILDHGGGFMTVYGYNDSLLRRAGQNVTAGENIAAAGSSGGNNESGLYFELRSQGQPVDPLKWVSLK
ncbi:MAG: hypothetical protein RIR70_1713 [Pseudomonadota bacterium]